MKEDKIILAVDIGNSRVKLAIVGSSGVLAFRAFPTEGFTDYSQVQKCYTELVSLWGGDSKTLRAGLISSVVPRVNQIALCGLQKCCGFPVKFIEATANFGDLVIPSPNKSGLDILCKAAFLASLKTSVLCLDSGTATVINFINHHQKLCGVGITAGYKGLYKTLHTEAELVPLYSPSQAERLLGSTTETAVVGGNYFAYLHLLNGLVKQAISETGCTKVYYTGGFSFLFTDNVDFNHVWDKELLLKGIYLIYQNNIEDFE